MGVGLVDEVDDIRASNPSSNPELFDKLGQKLVEYKLTSVVGSRHLHQRSLSTQFANEREQRLGPAKLLTRLGSPSTRRELVGLHLSGDECT